LGESVVAHMQPQPVAGGSGLKVKGSTAAGWGPQYTFDEGSALPTSYALSGSGVRLGGKGSEAVASAGTSSPVSAEQFEKYFGRAPQIFDVDRGLLASAVTAGGFATTNGGTVIPGSHGVMNIGPISTTRFALDDLPDSLRSVYGPTFLARDAIGQPYMAVPMDASGTMKYWSPPAADVYVMPTVSELQSRQMGRGAANVLVNLPSTAAAASEILGDFMAGAFGARDSQRSPLWQDIREGRITASTVLFDVVENSFPGFVANLGQGSPESLYRAGQTVGGTAVLSAAGLAGTGLARYGTYRVELNLDAPGTLYSNPFPIKFVAPDASASRLVVMNKEGVLYPVVPDPRTGRSIPFPAGDVARIPKADRVSWDSSADRYAYIKDWHDRGYEAPRGGWAQYDIHHIRPREFGGDNSFWNLVPVQRQTHRDLFNRFWQGN